LIAHDAPSLRAGTDAKPTRPAVAMEVRRPSRIDSGPGLSPIEQQPHSLGFNQRTDHGPRASLSAHPTGPMGIMGQEEVAEPIDRGPERIMKILTHLIPHSLGERDVGEKMDMGKRLAQLPVRQSSKESHQIHRGGNLTASAVEDEPRSYQLEDIDRLNSRHERNRLKCTPGNMPRGQAQFLPPPDTTILRTEA